MHEPGNSRRFLFRVAALLVCAVAIVPACGRQPEPRYDGDPSKWAAPIEGQPGLRNLYQVSDGLYRGAQPSKAGFASLAEMGIKTVIDLRAGHDESRRCADNGLHCVHIPTEAWKYEEEAVIRFLQVVRDEENHPVFVHCRRGADRAGLSVAVYRVVVDGWTKQEALAEMVDGPYRHNPKFKNLADYVEAMDVEMLREASE